jgi:hypothetical protein
MRETAPPERVFGLSPTRMSYARSSYSPSRQNLTLLCHDRTSPIDNEIEESQPRRAPLG